MKGLKRQASLAQRFFIGARAGGREIEQPKNGRAISAAVARWTAGNIICSKSFNTMGESSTSNVLMRLVLGPAFMWLLRLSSFGQPVLVRFTLCNHNGPLFSLTL